MHDRLGDTTKHAAKSTSNRADKRKRKSVTEETGAIATNGGPPLKRLKGDLSTRVTSGEDTDTGIDIGIASLNHFPRGIPPGASHATHSKVPGKAPLEASGEAPNKASSKVVGDITPINVPPASSASAASSRPTPYGMAGGNPGIVGRNFVFGWNGRGGHDKITLSSQAVVNLELGEIMQINTPGEVDG
ncbi:hypothetical protein GGR53DRAFT_532088 [Hypoxylon sp. FL1150]|nr:hypothetical protein GGR53DRAFT_532088 [Hypoxylon sp. FL1150]